MTAPLSTWPPGPITPYGDWMLRHGAQPITAYRSFDNSQAFQLMGGFASATGLRPAVSIVKIKGLFPPWKLLDQQGARQTGVTNLGAVGDPIKIDMQCVVTAPTVREKRRVIRAWIDSWAPDQQGEFSWITPQAGKWWGPARWMQAPVDELLNAKVRKQVFNWQLRVDAGAWTSIISAGQWPLTPITGSGSGWINLSNLGDQPGYWSALLYGPFDQVSLGNGPFSQNMITFGPLLSGQIVMLNTDPRLPQVVDLSPSQPPQTLNRFQKLLENLITYATNANVPPLLQQFESVFGILPPQTTMGALLSGAFTDAAAIPPKPVAQPPVTSHIAVSVTGASSATKVIAALRPLRRWPE